MTAAGRLARVLAVVIAVLGIVDPAIATSRRVPATVAVIDSMRGGRPSAPADGVARALGDDYRIVRGPAADAAATVVVGDRLPAHAGVIDGPAFVVRPDTTVPAVIVTGVEAPARAGLDSRVPVRVRVEAHGIGGRTIAIGLRRDGVVLDRIERQASGARARISVDLSFVSGAPGVAALQVEVTAPGAFPARADLAIDVRRDRARVLFFDGRPSWLSTFVRRELEAQAGFEVAHRTRTSRGLGAATTGAPAALAGLDAIDDFHAVVVSAPESLSRADVAGLESFARARGGSVMVLLDADPGATLAPLVGADRWQSAMLPAPEGVDMSALGMDRIQAAELVWPVALQPRARVLARATAEQHPVLFEVPLGAGRVLVSGLSDVWRYRGDSATSPFAAMWPRLIGDAARASLAPIDIAITPSAAAPGDVVEIAVAQRGLLLAPAAPSEARIEARLIDERGAATSIRLWPDGAPGMFRGAFRAPASPGVRRVHVTTGSDAADAPLVVADGARRPEEDDSDLLAAWAATRAGRSFGSSEIDRLRVSLAAALPETRADVRWHVMRSGWWIVGFALALGLEWRDRRRRGHR